MFKNESLGTVEQVLQQKLAIVNELRERQATLARNLDYQRNFNEALKAQLKSKKSLRAKLNQENDGIKNEIVELQKREKELRMNMVEAS